MAKIVIDPTLARQLERLIEPTEFCDETGKVLGEFVPRSKNGGFVESPISREEMERRKQSTKWYTTEEVLRHLENL
jgi:hypothetical protein